MSVFPVFKITKMLRSPEDDMTDFILLGQQYRLIARPIKYWKYFPWSRRFHGKKVFYQCPWLTFFSFPDEARLQGRLWTPEVLRPLVWFDASDFLTLTLVNGDVSVDPSVLLSNKSSLLKNY